MKPRKTTTIRYTDAEGKRCKADTPGAVKTKVASRKYYAQITLPSGKRQSMPLCSDFARSKQVLAERLDGSKNPAVEFLFSPGVRATLARLADAENCSMASLAELLVKEALSARGDTTALD